MRISDWSSDVCSSDLLQGREHNFPRELSGGQQQRVGIARSLIGECDVWFLDEPFSALDPLIRREMQDEFVSLQSRLNKSIVFVTHDFDEAARLGDRIAIMKDGRLAQIGTAEELLMTPANDYVKKFVQHAPRAKLITAQRVMVPANPGDISLTNVQNPIRRSEEHTSELQSLMRISYAVFCLKKKKKNKNNITT